MSIRSQLSDVRETLPEGVTLVAVSKTHAPALIEEAYAAGQRIFGESRPQELAAKYEALPKDIEWHMIGHLQSNKIKFIVPFVRMIHSVDSPDLLRKINAAAEKAGRRIDCLLEVHIAREETKFGFSGEEALEMADAIDDLCSPTDNYGWASAGIYCFWDYYAEAVLYIGLAGGLAERFKQHNGILPIKEGSKQKQIEDYFSRNERLGYTIFVQSPLSQPLVHRNRKVYEKFAKQQNSPIEDMLSEQGRDDIKRVEGILIESFRRKYGHFPLWNSMGGSMVGQTKVMENNINIVNSFCQPDNYAINPIVSRSTIRELSRNPEWEWYENYLHAARMNLLILGMEYDEALEFINKNDTLGTYERMKKSGYLRKRLIV